VKRILLTIKDFETTTITSPIVEKTAELAGYCSSKVFLIHITPPPRHSPFNVDSEVFRREIANELRHEHKSLQQLANCMREKNIDTTALLVHGPVIKTILQEAERLAIDLVILGRHKHGHLYSALMDDTEEGLLAKSTCPVMFVPM